MKRKQFPVKERRGRPVQHETPRVTVTSNVSEETHQKLIDIATSRDCSQSHVIDVAIQALDWICKHAPQGANNPIILTTSGHDVNYILELFD